MYSLQQLDLPYYSLMHQQSKEGEGIKMYFGKNAPAFVRIKRGHTIPILHDHDFNSCVELVDDIKRGVMLPQYVVLG